MGGFRTYTTRASWGEWMTPAILWLLIANTAVFFIEVISLWSSPGAYAWLLRWFGLVPYGITHGFRVWQPFTYMFLHDGFGLGHYFWNMLTLWMFGRDLERSWGRRKFFVFYFLTGAGSGLLNVAARTAIDWQGTGAALVTTIGASGAIYGILMANAILFPDRRVGLIFPPVVLPMKFFVFIWGLLAFFGTLMPSAGGVSHFTHLSGMLVAYLYLRRGTFLFSLRNRYLDWKRRRARRKFEVYMRNHGDEPPSRPDNWVN
jgi:membrane associated rhomboid family serine protease